MTIVENPTVNLIQLWGMNAVGSVIVGLVAYFWWRLSDNEICKNISLFFIITSIYWGIIDKVLSYFSGGAFCQLAELNTRNSKAYYSLCEKAGLWGDGYVSMGIFIVLLIIVYLWNRNKY